MLLGKATPQTRQHKRLTRLSQPGSPGAPVVERGYLCSFCQSESQLQTRLAVCKRTVPSWSMMPLPIASIPRLPRETGWGINLTANSPCDPTVPSHPTPVLGLLDCTRPCEMVSGPGGLHSGHWPGRIELRLPAVEETNAYVPSNCVLAVGDDGACAPAAETKPKNPRSDSHPVPFGMTYPPNLLV
jgi:hypothetical protein